jgi:hypothetical protein
MQHLYNDFCHTAVPTKINPHTDKAPLLWCGVHSGLWHGVSPHHFFAHRRLIIQHSLVRVSRQIYVTL